MPIAKRLVKENDGDNANPERKRQIMDLAMRLKDAELMGEEKGLQKGFQEGLHQSVVNAVINLAKVAKGSKFSRETIFKFAQAMADGRLSDDEINQLIDQQN